jgi:hypothetical protein
MTYTLTKMRSGRLWSLIPTRHTGNTLDMVALLLGYGAVGGRDGGTSGEGGVGMMVLLLRRDDDDDDDDDGDGDDGVDEDDDDDDG